MKPDDIFRRGTPEVVPETETRYKPDHAGNEHEASRIDESAPNRKPARGRRGDGCRGRQRPVVGLFRRLEAARRENEQQAELNSSEEAHGRRMRVRHIWTASVFTAGGIPDLPVERLLVAEFGRSACLDQKERPSIGEPL